MIKEKFNLEGKVAVITGASKGIGKAIALGFAEFGAHVVVSSRSEEAVKNVETEFKSKGFSVSSLKCHVGNKEDRISLIETTLKSHGRIDILVNNAVQILTLDQFIKCPRKLIKRQWILI